MFLRQWIWSISFSSWWFSSWPMESLSKLSCTQTSVHPGLWHLESSSGHIFNLMGSSLFKLQTLVGIPFFRPQRMIILVLTSTKHMHLVNLSSISAWLQCFHLIRYHDDDDDDDYYYCYGDYYYYPLSSNTMIPDTSNLQGNSKKLRVIGILKQILNGNKEMEMGNNVSSRHTSLQGQQEVYWYGKKELSNKAWLTYRAGHCNRINSVFWSAVPFFYLFNTRLKNGASNWAALLIPL